ncbi:MAG TPA: glycosyltransferase family 4 protein [Bryobacteraceae bacterium]
MQITIYSPDRHFLYDGSTPDAKGVGGGLTARVRLAAALARRGHQVSLICNCPGPSVHDGVPYFPLESVDRIATEALVVHSSGGAFDITPLLSIPIQAKTQIVVSSGIGLPKGTLEFAPHAVYACSNFLRDEIARLCPFVPRKNIFVTHYGINRWNWTGLFDRARDPRRLIYSSHPSKGLEASREVVRRLRRNDERFSLHCYGGNQLWGQAEETPPAEPGIFYHGLINQRDLAAEYKRSAFLMQLQTRPEPFGITVVEGMAAGCLVVASPVGAFTELIQHGQNGFLIEGDPADPKTLDRAAELIRTVSENPELARKIRRQAFTTPFDWDTIAAVWEAHLGWLIDRDGSRNLEPPWAHCAECGAASLALADGYHCTCCGYFGRSCGAGW